MYSKQICFRNWFIIRNLFLSFRFLQVCELWRRHPTFLKGNYRFVRVELEKILMNQKSKQDRSGSNGDRGSVDKSKNKYSDDLRKACQTKNTDLEGIVSKATKEFVWILVQEHYSMRMGYTKLYGPEPAVVKYKVDDYIRVSLEENVSTKWIC